MDLILWRHAEAQDGTPDLERKLTAKGRRQAARVARWLLRRLPSKFDVISSPARRARQTADALEVDYEVIERLAPGASVTEILKASGWPKRKGAVVLVGHQPDFGNVAALLVSSRDGDWAVKKAGLWWLEGRVRNGAMQVVVRAVIAPDLV